MLRLGAAALDRRLDPQLTQPLAVAFSGGGDSLAALILAKAWADACGRSVVALHVDHGLQSMSGAWRDFAASIAARLGVGFQALVWCGEKPARGLSARARLARHALIAEAAREIGATAVVLGHTADDIAEAMLMRDEGVHLGQLADWRPSPVWPEGRGVFLLRPLLSIRRAAIRRRLAAGGWSWIDDPANADPVHPRVRARRKITDATEVPAPAADDAAAASLASGAILDAWGAVRLDRDALRRAPAASAQRIIGAAMLSAGGGANPPRADRAATLTARVRAAGEVIATLAGGKLIAGRDVLVVRNAGEVSRGGLAPIALNTAEAAVWDGRFEIRVPLGGVSVQVLKGRASALPAPVRRALTAVPAEARAALPLISDAQGGLACPVLAGDDRFEVRSLVGARFLAACGAVSKEPRA